MLVERNHLCPPLLGQAKRNTQKLQLRGHVFGGEANSSSFFSLLHAFAEKRNKENRDWQPSGSLKCLWKQRDRRSHARSTHDNRGSYVLPLSLIFGARLIFPFPFLFLSQASCSKTHSAVPPRRLSRSSSTAVGRSVGQCCGGDRHIAAAAVPFPPPLFFPLFYVVVLNAVGGKLILPPLHLRVYEKLPTPYPPFTLCSLVS